MKHSHVICNAFYRSSKMTSNEQYEQRERIATAAMAAILSRRSVGGTYADIAQSATKYADALIEELNKEA